MEHQDWKIVTLRKNTQNTKTHNVNKQYKNNDYNPVNCIQPNISNMELGKAINKARCAKLLTLSDLDKKCCFPKNTVKNYENCTAIIIPSQINKLNDVLGVVLPRPKKNKLQY